MSGNGGKDDDAFYNPYQFVPMGGARPAEGGITADSIRDRKGMGRLAHDHYAEGTLSGRIICRLTTESEIVIGGNRQSAVNPDRNTGKKGKSGIVHPVLRDGRPLIPATGLRGCISSIAEAISFSAMRVQANEPVRIRNDRNDPPSFRGYIHDFFSAQYDEGPEEFEEARRKKRHRETLHQERRERMPHSADRERPRKKKHRQDQFQIPEDKDLPMILKRQIVTAAEAIFGFVGDEKQAGDGKTDAYRGRVRFSDAQLGGGEGRDGPFIAADGKGRVTGDSKNFTTLKTLAEPKAAVSANYFETRPDTKGKGGGQRVGKDDLRVRSRDDVPVSGQQPLGRKFYLHGSPRNNELLPGADRRDDYPRFWRSQAPGNFAHQKSRALPLARGLRFFFHVDFDNLSPTELGLLVTALNPDQAFRHKIGMGKPIGLGTVHIEIAGVLQVDRQKRYGTGDARAEDPFAAPRHHAVWLDPDIDVPEGALSRRIWPAARAESQVPGLSPLKLREQFTGSESCDQCALTVLKQIGDPATTKNARVHYPATADAVERARVKGDHPAMEKNGYKWFVMNDPIGKPLGPQKLASSDSLGPSRLSPRRPRPNGGPKSGR